MAALRNRALLLLSASREKCVARAPEALSNRARCVMLPLLVRVESAANVRIGSNSTWTRCTGASPNTCGERVDVLPC